MTDLHLDGPVPGDPFLMVGALDLQAAGYVGEEWFLSSTAASYTLAGERSEDGRWSVRRAAREPFKTPYQRRWEAEGRDIFCLEYQLKPRQPR